MADNEAIRQAEADPANARLAAVANQANQPNRPAAVAAVNIRIPQDRPENNQGRIAYEAVIRRIMDTRECSYEVARRIYGQMGFTAAHGGSLR